MKPNIGIVGGGGYAAGELIRLLVNHPGVTIEFVYSRSQGGKPITSVHQDLVGKVEMDFAESVNPEVDVIFLCMGHGNSRSFLEDNPLPDDTKIIDISRDFRLSKDAEYKDGKRFVYGLPELNHEKIKTTDLVANPGCYASAIELALLPLASEQQLKQDIHVQAITGSTGAGRKPSKSSHFSRRDGNISIYKALNHQHEGEIKESIRSLQNDFDQKLNIIPMRGNYTRGIFVTAYTKTDLEEKQAIELYNDFYSDAQFTYVSSDRIHLKQVVNTNRCMLDLQKLGDNLLITSTIDNLLKGASGQAVQNMNLMLGLCEDAGLQLKASYF
ncbi:N-acetyl-gamma-glutamyl-phosphate reductase [Aliifodinibius sp. S!AR15-10]|uniref:N-acetyl-gamma-glutamyl-phosphate reductase n=1 Tax=Aliifodinibius sp. S!AR15-10 TaxID=2950437 RepID=UPI0028640FAF|nr:N-acetyl-gamma-glutamyl-phosphate reductase [Aliifodinibius sp. S!AR15-10]MDR8389942.1 N-acetyl-gamma-glutamyl-phosphate reductase [Aliifodinibius sp. S!AR15-10]